MGLNVKKIFASFLLIFFFSTTRIFSQDEPAPQKRIGSIKIEAQDIFDTSQPSESKWLYRTINFLHIQTHENVLRRELLFKEGDPYNADLIAETERNIRRFGFVRKIKISEEDQFDGTTNIVVHSKDTWTLEPQFDFSRVGNRTKTKIGVVERNLFGAGKKVSLFYNRGSEGTFRTITYRDQQFLKQKLELNTVYIDGADFKQYGGSLSQPFRSTLSKTSFEISNFFTEENLPAYRDGTEVGRFEKESREATFLVGKSLGSTTRLTRNGTLAFKQQNRIYSPDSGDTVDFIKPPIELSIVEIGANFQVIDFITEKRIESFDRDEDFNLGAGIGSSFGVGQNWKNNKRTELLPQITTQIGHMFSPGQFSLAKAKYRSRLANTKTDNLLLNLNLQYFNRLTEKNTLACNLSYDHGYRLDPEDQLLLGEDTGLRGYSIAQFTGERRVLFNLENRSFFAEDVWHLVSFGSAIFFDSGYAWGKSHDFSPSDLRNSIGCGLRIAMSRSSRNEPIRIDLAYALNNNKENSRLVLSVRSGVKFGTPEGKQSGQK